ncbi:MAG: phosphotransferase [Nitrospiraceae bacterium]|nr:phosphotransferase [Nitrospiraceae bacterium]
MDRAVTKGALLGYLRAFGVEKVLAVKSMGRGAHGEGWLIRTQGQAGEGEFVIKSVRPAGLGHDYPSDRAGMFLLALDTFNSLPNHVKALDVISLRADGTLGSVGAGKEYYLLMRKAEGKNYFEDLESFRTKEALGAGDVLKIDRMVRYLAGIHSLKKTSRGLYLRKLRDIIGHGECLMGVFDTYPRGVLPSRQMAGIEKKCIDWRAKLKRGYRRLCLVHGDFHPGNVWFGGGKDSRAVDIMLLDRSRGPWGEPADDVTALVINYIFFSVMHHGRVEGAYLEALRIFFRKYMRRTGDAALLSVVAPFFAFRGAVVANPVFYPELSREGRQLIFRFINAVLDTPEFDPARVNDYLS